MTTSNPSGAALAEKRLSKGIKENELLRLLGNMFLVGFDGMTLTNELQELIESHFVGAILLTSKNVHSAAQASDLIRSLQWCAYQAGYDRPLLIAIDQENGSLNSLSDESITQFPSSMGMAAIGSPQHTRRVAAATAYELGCVGVNWIIGPVLDVLSASRPSPLGVRAFGDDPITVLTHGLETVHAFKKSGVASCGKHFPSYGDVEFIDGTELNLPTICTTIEELQNRAFIPFRACSQAGLNAILVGGCTLELRGKKFDYACLEKSVVTGILRNECDFEGVIVSECLAMEALRQDIGISQGTTRAVRAGCDMITICHSYQAQLEGFNALKLAIGDGRIPLQAILESNDRINAMKAAYTSWERALNPRGPESIAEAKTAHSALSEEVYKGAISLVRDTTGNLPYIRGLHEDEEVLLLSPLIEMFPSTATKRPRTLFAPGRLAPGEDTFQLFGEALSKELKAKLTHTSYSSNGLRPMHEDLISRASAVIILTADATRNAYQYGVTKHVNVQCRYQPCDHGQRKPLVVVALSSPYDFLSDNDINTYICTYDFTSPSLTNLAHLISGSLSSANNPPLTSSRRSNPQTLSSDEPPAKTSWLVEVYDTVRDQLALEGLLSKMANAPPLTFFHNQQPGSVDNTSERRCFVVRNSSTRSILGILITLVFNLQYRGQIGPVFVDPDRIDDGIENSLREYALQYLVASKGLAREKIVST